ncbi:MAG: DUF3280 domain-containing protein [Polaromonas sp.]|nr:DUF3280 domain-containing protein [Polaromonas sp.]
MELKLQLHFRALTALVLMACLSVWCNDVAAAETGPPSLAVIGFELVDDHPDPARAELLRPRLAAIKKQLEQGLHDRALYRIVETTSAQDLIDVQLAQNQFLYRCNDCLKAVGQRLGTRLVAVGWVQRVSELILNVNISVQDSQTGVEVLSKSVDLRGNTDETWARGVNFMLRDWAERRARNPRYGS